MSFFSSNLSIYLTGSPSFDSYFSISPFALLHLLLQLSSSPTVAPRSVLLLALWQNPQSTQSIYNKQAPATTTATTVIMPRQLLPLACFIFPVLLIVSLPLRCWVERRPSRCGGRRRHCSVLPDLISGINCFAAVPPAFRRVAPLASQSHTGTHMHTLTLPRRWLRRCVPEQPRKPHCFVYRCFCYWLFPANGVQLSRSAR